MDGKSDGAMVGNDEDFEFISAVGYGKEVTVCDASENVSRSILGESKMTGATEGKSLDVDGALKICGTQGASEFVIEGKLEPPMLAQDEGASDETETGLREIIEDPGGSEDPDPTSDGK